MRPSTFRRIGAALLLALFVPGCVDAPTAPPGPAGVAPERGAAAVPTTQGFPPEGGIPGLVEHRRTRGDLDVRLYASKDGKLRHLAARRAGKPAVHLRWHYRGDGAVERVSATLYLPDGQTRELPDVARAAGPGAASRALAPFSSPALATSYAWACMNEWIELLEILLALMYAQLEEQWDLVAALTLAAMRASWALNECLWRNGGSV